MNHALKLVFGSLLLLIAGCKHEPIGVPGNGNTPNNPPNNPPPTTGCSADTVYFGNTVSPLITSNCAMSGCHDAITHRSGYNLTTYSGIRNIVTPGNAQGSKLISVVTRTGEEHMPPSPYASLTSNQVGLLRTWINQGAKNNGCNSTTCDTTNITYALSVVPILQNACTGCHSGSSPSGGINLTTYAGIKAVADNGKLLGAITHKSGFFIMPPSGWMQSCDIAKIRTWIRNGTLNN